MTRKIVDVVVDGAYTTEYTTTKNENSYLCNTLWKKGKKKGINELMLSFLLISGGLNLRVLLSFCA
ncbi:MAG: hypothetical protein M3298_05370 [Thermoproteota archaeon]|nr:hypothetical protein [Thermoproteota archaeon]MDQ3883604.1 hypothetical protein [Thermoproteota archaeon]